MANRWNKTVLVTGSTGFVGRHLVTRLRQHGAHVIYPTRDLGGDILSDTLVTDDIDMVVHLAGRTFVVDAWSDPVDFFRVNALGTMRMLEQCRKKKVPFVYISAYVYGSPKSDRVSESHPVEPNNPYAFSKFAGEEACRFYNQVFNIPLVIFRLFNVYGPGQDKHFLIPFVIDQALSRDQETVVVADLTPKRDYVYIDDVVDAICESPKLLNGNTYNVGSGVPTSVREVIETVLRYADPGKRYRDKGDVRPNEIASVVADTSALTRDCGWVAATSFDNGIQKTISAKRP